MPGKAYSALTTTAYLSDTERPQTTTRKLEEVGQPLTGLPGRGKTILGTRIGRPECVEHILTNLECCGPNGWPEPGRPLVGRARQLPERFESGFDDASRQSSPARMGRTNPLADAVGYQNRQAIRAHYGKHPSSLVRNRCIGNRLR